MEEEEEEPPQESKKRKERDWPSPSESPEIETKKLADQIDRLAFLPDVLIGDILLNIHSIRDIAWLCTANKRINSICKNPDFWAALYYGDHRLDLPLDQLLGIANSSEISTSQLKNLYKWENTVSFIKTPLVKYMPNVRLGPGTQWRKKEEEKEYTNLLQVRAIFYNPETREPRLSNWIPVREEIHIPSSLGESLHLPLIETYVKIDKDGITYEPAVLISPKEIRANIDLLLNKDDYGYDWEEQTMDDQVSTSSWNDVEILSANAYHKIQGMDPELGELKEWDLSLRKESSDLDDLRGIRMGSIKYSMNHEVRLKMRSVMLENSFEARSGNDTVSGIRLFREYVYWMHRDMLHQGDPDLYEDIADMWSTMITRGDHSPTENDYEVVRREQMFRRRWIWGTTRSDIGSMINDRTPLTKAPVACLKTEPETETEEEERLQLVAVSEYPGLLNDDRISLVSLYDRDLGKFLCKEHVMPRDIAESWFEWHWVGPEIYCPYCTTKTS